MDLAQKLRQARLDAGLSQRQLCGDRITRNMLSQIENGSAHPSMETLKYLAQQLGKPMSFFLEEQAVSSPNLQIMEQARKAQPSDALSILGQYQAPDPVFDAERWLLEALTCMTLAEAALAQNRTDYARSLLARTAVTGSRTPYYTQDNERRRLLLCYRAGEKPDTLESQLPDLTEELLLRAQNALAEGNYDRCEALLYSATRQDKIWHYQMGQLRLAQKDYSAAMPHFEKAWVFSPISCCQAMELCCREMQDYAGAYSYACKLRELQQE